MITKIKKLFNKKQMEMIKDPALNINCSEFEINNWELSEFILKKVIPVLGVRPFPLNELLLMSGSVAYFKPTHIFEWGTNIGISARIFHETIEYFSIKSAVHSIDLPDTVYHVEHPGVNRGLYVQGKKDVYLHQGDGLDTSYSIWTKEGKPGNVLFFLDGDHSYESVNRELQFISKNIPTAKILVHDTFYQSEKSKYNIGPFQAVNNLNSSSKNYKIISTQTGLPGMTLLYPEI